MRFRNRIAAGVCCLSWTGLLAAGDVRPSEIPAKADWYVHLDVARFSDEAMKPLLRAVGCYAEVKVDAATKGLPEIDFDPLADVEQATLFGSTAEEDHVLVVHFKRRRSKVAEIFGRGDRHVVVKHGAHEIHSWRERSIGSMSIRLAEGADAAEAAFAELAAALEKLGGESPAPSPPQRTYAGLLGDDAVVFADDLKTVVDVLEAAEGKAPNQATAPSGLLLPRGKGSFLQASLRGVQTEVRPNVKLNVVGIVAALRDGNLEVEGSAEAVKASDAVNVKLVADGARALAYLALDADEAESVGPLLEAFRVETAGKTIRFSWKMEAGKLTSIAEKLLKEREDASDADSKDEDAQGDD